MNNNTDGLTKDNLDFLEAIGLVKKGLTEMAEAKKEENRFKNIDVTVVRGGTKIILPNDPVEMNYDEAIDSLNRIKKSEETQVSVYEVVNAFPFDGALSFMKALQQIYGWATPVPRPGFFGDTPPVTVSVEIGPNETTQVIWGDFKIPGIEGVLSTGMHSDGNKMLFRIGGEVKKKNQRDVKRIADLTREIAKNESIYRGKAIRLEVRNNDRVNFGDAPKFLDVSKVNANELTFSETVMAQIQTNLFTPVEHTEKCRKYGIPLKRGILLEGPYGTGKTLTAFVTAQKAVANGWTFIMLDKVSGLKDALEFARMYAPACVFSEDIDRAVSGERSIKMDDVLNTIDGIESKGKEIITILTSNHVEDINQAMLRPGCLDAVISVQAPDAKAAEKLIRIYSRDMLAENAELTAAGKELEGRIPAVIRETVERSKLYAISRWDGKGEIQITQGDLVYAAREMKNHLDLLAPKKPETSNAIKLATALGEIVQESVKGNGLYSLAQETEKRVQKIESAVC